MTTIVLWVGDLTRSAEYYKDLFGASNYYLTDGFASVAGNGNEVLLHLVPEEYRNTVSVGEDNPIKPVFSVTSLDLARNVAIKHDCSFVVEAMEHNGKNFLDGKDPDGHIIQVVA
jgi:catechol 2,3-dioxygenase-like lactoylglutathione lyase family enzyme